jgi:ABC-2 type transport system permease protein
VNPVDVNPVEANPAEVNPAEVNPAEVNPAEVNPAEVNPAEVDPVEARSRSAVAGSDPGPAREPVAGPGVPFLTALAVVYRGQLARARVARVPLLFVATFQSVGIILLLRGVVDTDSAVTRQSVVAGATVLVVGFVALNLLAQQLGMLRDRRALDYYATLPVPPAAVLLGLAGAYASFTFPGAVFTAFAGALLYQLPITQLWVLVLVLPLAGAALAGVGATVGLLAPRPELATVAGQLGMSAVLFLGVIPPDRLPVGLLAARAVLPSSYAVDALAACLASRVAWGSVTVDLVVCAVAGAVTLTAGVWAFRRATRR